VDQPGPASRELPRLDRVGIVGLGLIGGSLLQAAAARGHRVVGYDADTHTRELAAAAGYPIADGIAALVGAVDVVVLSVPLPALPSVLAEVSAALADHPSAGPLITDVTSVKAPVLELVRRAGLAARYVGGHPMAGTERSGWAAADPALFTGAAWVLALEPDTDPAGWLALARLVTGLGARAVPAPAADHDRAVAMISGLPHLLAVSLAALAGTDPLALALGAGSFRDATRVAGTRPELVAALWQGNRAALLTVTDDLLARLAAARSAIAAGEAHAPAEQGELRALAEQGQAARARWEAAAGLRAVEHAVTGWLSAPADRPEQLVPPLLALGRAGGTVTAVEQDAGTVVVQTSQPAGDDIA